MSQDKDNREIKKTKVDFSEEEIDKITKNFPLLVKQCTNIRDFLGICEACTEDDYSTCHVCGITKCAWCWSERSDHYDCDICDRTVCRKCGIRRIYDKRNECWDFCNPCYNNESNRPPYDHTGKSEKSQLL